MTESPIPGIELFYCVIYKNRDISGYLMYLAANLFRYKCKQTNPHLQHSTNVLVLNAYLHL